MHATTQPSRREPRRQPREQTPRIDHVLEHVAEHPAVGRAERVEIGIAHSLEVDRQHATAMAPRKLRILGLELDPDVLAVGIGLAVVAGQRSGAAARLDDAGRAGRHQRQQVGVRDLVRGSLLHVRR